MGQLRAKYRFCAVWALSAAVRPAFAVFIYAPGGGNRAKRFQLHRFGAIFKRGGLGACYAERPRRAGRSWRYCMKTLKTIYLFYILNRNYKKFHIFFVDSSKRFQKDIFLRSPLLMAWPNKSATAFREDAPPGRFLIPQGGGKVRTPHDGSVPSGAPCCAGTALRTRSLWDNCEPSTGFVQFRRSVRQYDLLLRCCAKCMGPLRTKYRFCIAQALSAAVRPAFAVLTCAPGLGFSGFRLPSFIVEVLRWIRG